MYKTIVILVVAAVIIGGAFFVIKSKRESPSVSPDRSTIPPFPTPTPTTPSPTPQPSPTPSPEPQPAPQPSPIPPPSPAKSVEVLYTDSGYQPGSITVEVGATVVFKNQSANPMWTASDPHPVHTNLSGFDNLKGLGEGESYSFTFTQKGTWGYHNHLLPGHRGVIIVE